MGNSVAIYLSIFWLIYGIGGLFGYCVPKKYKGYSWSKNYSKEQGICWLMIAIPCLFITVLIKLAWIEVGKNLLYILLLVCVPGIVYSFIIDKKYNTLLKEEDTNEKD